MLPTAFPPSEFRPIIAKYACLRSAVLGRGTPVQSFGVAVRSAIFRAERRMIWLATISGATSDVMFCFAAQ